jgi:peptidoglycan/xylan/chitin deacetylase (PgdA/CDA1 family)
MRFNVFLIFFNLTIISQYTWAKMDFNNLKPIWGNITVEKSKFHIDYLSTNDENFFISYDSSELELDLKRDNLYFNLRLGSLKNINGVEIRLSEESNSNNFYYYSLPYFSDLEFNPYKDNEWFKLGISQANLKLKGKAPNKIKYINFFISSNKQNALIGFKDIYKKVKATPGIVTITFDDGYQSQLLASEITKKYNLNATAYIMPRDVGKKNYLNLNGLKKLKNNNWEIQSHHNAPLTWMSPKELKEELSYGIKYIKENNLNSTTQHLAYPLGKQNQLVVNEVEKFFATARVAGGGIETIPPADFHRIRTYNVLNTTTPKELKKVIQETKNAKQWLILMFHYINDDPQNELHFSSKKFEEVCKIIKESNIKNYTISEVYEKYLK